jgi:hypothetical protein
VPDYGWLLVQGIDDLDGVIGDLLEGLLGEDLRLRPGPFNRFGIVWPVGCANSVSRGEAVLVDESAEAVSALHGSRHWWAHETERSRRWIGWREVQ